MLSSDEPITLLIERLDALARPDRTAILKRLSPLQRRQIDRLRTNRQAWLPERHSPELIERLAQLDNGTSPLTPAARDALRHAMRPEPSLRVGEAARGASLADAAGGLFKKLGRV